MKRVEIKKVEHDRKVNQRLEYLEPNIDESILFHEDGEDLGFFMKKMPEKLCKLADLANEEFLSDRVPKTEMFRAETVKYIKEGHSRAEAREWGCTQMSCILGGVPASPVHRRHHNNLSQVHKEESAKTFIKAMYALAMEVGYLVRDILPAQYERQLELMSSVPDRFKFGELFTSSISNFNISVPFHKDQNNIVGTVNCIITKRRNSKGGNLFVPDYDANFNQTENSLLVYPVWRNLHAVTPIVPTHDGGYRNSLVFYPIKHFQKTTDATQ